MQVLRLARCAASAQVNSGEANEDGLGGDDLARDDVAVSNRIGGHRDNFFERGSRTATRHQSWILGYCPPAVEP